MIHINMNISGVSEQFRAASAEAALLRVGRALAHPIRLQVLLRLLDAPGYPTELAAQIGISRTALANHLSCLRGCGIVTATPEGRRLRYEIADPHLAEGLRQLLAAAVVPLPQDCCATEVDAALRASAALPECALPDSADDAPRLSGDNA